MTRSTLENIKRIIIKVGTSTLTHSNGTLNQEKIAKIVEECSELQQLGLDVVLVTSGAVGAGMGQLHLKEKPKTVSEKQAVASIGQVELVALYQRLFSQHNIIIGQLLLTKMDFSDRKRYLNARNVCHHLLKQKVIPVINENDAVVADEIKVGDNDTLSALVSGLIDGDLLVLVTDIDGLYDSNPKTNKDAKLLSEVTVIDDSIRNMAQGEGSKFGTGGMITKIKAAEIATAAGCHCLIVSGEDPSIIRRALANATVGTLFTRQKKKLTARKSWLAYGSHKQGTIIVDDGATLAITCGKSLLPVGIIDCHSTFDKGAIVKINNRDNKTLAIGMSNYTSEEIQLIKGVKSEEIERILGHKYDDVVIHSDNMSVLEKVKQ